MKEYGIKLKDTKDGVEYSIYYTPLSYGDWNMYSDSKSMTDINIIRYLFATYITRIDSTSDTEITVESLSTKIPSFINTIVENMIDDSGYNDNTNISNIVDKVKENSRKLAGAYDYFLWLYLDPGTYLMLLDCDIDRRAHIIAMLENRTGITVLERFKDSVSGDSGGLDLITDNDKYMKEKRRGMKFPPRPQAKEQVPPQFKGADIDMPHGFDDMVSQSRNALNDELNFYNKNKEAKKKTFDWNKDNASLASFEKDKV